MHVNEMRDKITKAYKSETWQLKVSKMSDENVTAVYLRFLKDGIFSNCADTQMPMPEAKTIFADEPIKVKTEIIAVDFDGTLCENKWPLIGEPIQKYIEYIKDEKAKGNKIILWTCRTGKQLEDAVKWCSEKGIIFDAVNDNLPEMSAKFGGNSRKIYADRYIDDKAFAIF